MSPALGRHSGDGGRVTMSTDRQGRRPHDVVVLLVVQRVTARVKVELDGDSSSTSTLAVMPPATGQGHVLHGRGQGRARGHRPADEASGSDRARAPSARRGIAAKRPVAFLITSPSAPLNDCLQPVTSHRRRIRPGRLGGCRTNNWTNTVVTN